MKNLEGYAFVGVESISTCQVRSGLEEILETLNRSTFGTATVLEGMRVVGTITHGDLLKFAIREGHLPKLAAEVMNSKPVVFVKSANPAQLTARMESPRLVPVLNDVGSLIGGFVKQMRFAVEQSRPHVLISAGGRGSRLGSITSDIPKPLIRVGGVPILERLILQLRGYGFASFYISISYLGEQIKAYFGDGSSLGCEIRYLEEPEPLGNAGSLALLPEAISQVLLVNADLLTEANFNEFISVHNAGGAAITMLTSEISVRSEFGVVRADSDGTLVSLEEKPSLSLVVNAGVYVFELDRLRHLLPEGAFSAIDIVELLQLRQEPIQTCKTSAPWLDVGRPADLEKANKALALFSDSPAPDSE